MVKAIYSRTVIRLESSKIAEKRKRNYGGLTLKCNFHEKLGKRLTKDFKCNRETATSLSYISMEALERRID